MTDEYSDPVFIQWKGTEVCMDLHCPKCGYHNHYDGYFAYFVRCGICRVVWKLGQSVVITEAAPGDIPDGFHPLEDEVRKADVDQPQ